MNKLWLGAVALYLSSITAALSAPVFTFTAIPDQNETQLQQRFDKIARYLTKALGLEVRYVPVKSYASAVSAFRNNQVQLAWFGGLSGVQARRLVPGSKAIAQGFEDQSFKSYIIANSATGLKEAECLPAKVSDKTFTFGAKSSTSGRLMPEYYLREKYHAAPQAIFKQVGFSGDHSRTIALVQAGAYDLGAVNYAVWERELAAGRIDLNKVQVIWETPVYPDYQWTLRAQIDTEYGVGFSEKIQLALLNMRDKNLLKLFPRRYFIEANNSDYLPIERVAEDIGLLDRIPRINKNIPHSKKLL